MSMTMKSVVSICVVSVVALLYEYSYAQWGHDWSGASCIAGNNCNVGPGGCKQISYPVTTPPVGPPNAPACGGATPKHCTAAWSGAAASISYKTCVYNGSNPPPHCGGGEVQDALKVTCNSITYKVCACVASGTACTRCTCAGGTPGGTLVIFTTCI